MHEALLYMNDITLSAGASSCKILWFLPSFLSWVHFYANLVWNAFTVETLIPSESVELDLFYFSNFNSLILDIVIHSNKIGITIYLPH